MNFSEISLTFPDLRLLRDRKKLWVMFAEQLSRPFIEVLTRDFALNIARESPFLNEASRVKREYFSINGDQLLKISSSSIFRELALD